MLANWTDVDTKTPLPQLIQLLNRRLRPTTISTCDDCGDDEPDRTVGPGGTPGLLADWDPDLLYGLVPDGSTTDTIPDATGNGYDAVQPTAAQRFIFRENVLNAHAAVESHLLNNLTMKSPPVGNLYTGSTIVLVAQRFGTISGQAMFIRYENPLAPSFPASLSNSGFLLPALPLQMSGGGGNYCGEPVTSPFVALLQTSGGTTTPWFNGVKGTPFPTPTDLNAVVNVWFGYGPAGGGNGSGENFYFRKLIWPYKVTDVQAAAESLALMRYYGLDGSDLLPTLVADVAIANVETVLLRYTAPKNTLTNGTTFRFWAHSTRAGADLASPIYRVRVGPTTLTGAIAATLTGISSAVPDPRFVLGHVTFRPNGGTIGAIGGLREDQLNIAPAVNTLGALVAIDSQVANKIEFTFISGNAANTYTFKVGGIDIVKH